MKKIFFILIGAFLFFLSGSLFLANGVEAQSGYPMQIIK